ncbi:ninjurin-1 isoform X4 [Zophobas morio]|uniref:ninjurin-1 isoform X4 n=1 Tax=Zophobas morio TaxID=2755281 RepID=UPI00308364F4
MESENREYPTTSQTDGNLIGYIRKSLDANKYATKKTIAQGLLDVALLTANASQLKYVLQVGEKHEFYALMLTLISISIVLQLIVAILFVIIGGLNINKQRDHGTAVILNDVILIFIFLISIINIIISGFGLEYSNQPLQLIYEHTQPPPKL